MNKIKVFLEDRKRIAIVTSIGLLAILAIAFFGGTTVASAYVYGPGGSPIAGAFVYLTDYSQYNATTDSNGVYTILNVPIGTYSITASKPGYFPNTTTILVTEGTTVTKDINLSRGYEYYFAEGYNGPTQQVYFTIQNPNLVPANMIITYMRSDGSTVLDTALTSIGATTRATGRPYNFIQGAFSTKILTDEPIVAERPEYFNLPMLGGTVTGGHDTIAITEPNTTWYFAEGFNGPNQQAYIPIFNPNTTSSAHVTVTYMLADGTTVVDTGVTVIGPTTRATARPYNFVTGAFSTKIVSSDLPIVPERVMYFNLAMFGGNVNDGTTTIGTTSPNTTWYFAGGSNSATQQTYIPIQNPNNQPATLTITYLLPGGVTVLDTTTISAGATSRVTARPYNFVSGDFATKIVSDKPVIAESVVYFRNNMLGGTVDGGYVTIGASSIGKLWYFAEGYAGPTQQGQIAIGNPTNFPTALTITYMRPDGTTVIDSTITSVGANSRVTAFPSNFVQGAFSTLVESTTQPIVAERQMYFNLPMLGGTVTGGSNTIGVMGPLGI